MTSDEGISERNLKFCRHPYYPGRYAAIESDLVRVETDSGEWGHFDRNANWIEGPLRHADPIFCRWVTGELIAKECMARTETR